MFAMKREAASARLLKVLTKTPGLTAEQARKASGVGRLSLWPALQTLEASGQIVSDWRDGPYPRQRVYRLKDAAQ